MPEKNVLVIGGGVAGLSAAAALARLGIHVDLVERRSTLGGHSRQLTCKATDKCVKCGACIVEEKLKEVVDNPRITVHPGSRVEKVTNAGTFSVGLSDDRGSNHTCKAEAVIIASGFSPYKPEDRPYGYHRFENVITSLDLEIMLREKSFVKRPSDDAAPKKIAFIQCVGSRDEKHNHLWCSRVCCGSALRMSRLIISKRPKTEIILFYIDIQSVGRDFQVFFDRVQNEIRMIRAIPADVFKTEDDRLRITYYISGESEPEEELFDLIVLSIGITPEKKLADLASLFDIGLSKSGFIKTLDDTAKTCQKGIFAAGTVLGPMNIADSVAGAGRAVLEAAKYLEIRQSPA